MNKLMLKFVNFLPDPLITRFVKLYFNYQIKKHAQIHTIGLEYLESDWKRPYLFVCNHLSNSDGLILNKVLEKEEITFIAGKKLKSDSWTNLGLRLVRTIPISPNSADKEAIKRVLNTVKEGNSILIFPEGTRSRSAKMIEGKKGILLFARLTKAPVIPVAVWGTEKFMPIKQDMGNETFHDAEITIRIGEAFQLPGKTAEEAKADWEQACMQRIMGSIAELLPKEYRGVYDTAL